MKQEEQKPVDIEINDPKPPVIRSGRMESRIMHFVGVQDTILYLPRKRQIPPVS